jgi:hypothetical protein
MAHSCATLPELLLLFIELHRISNRGFPDAVSRVKRNSKLDI